MWTKERKKRRKENAGSLLFCMHRKEKRTETCVVEKAGEKSERASERVSISNSNTKIDRSDQMR
jgi:hypothetical protein